MLGNSRVPSFSGLLARSQYAYEQPPPHGLCLQANAETVPNFQLATTVHFTCSAPDFINQD
jgi:hypothetical protein